MAGWLALTLRDMACGWLHVGLGAAKGLGQVEIKWGDLKLKLGYLGDANLNLPANGEPSGIYQVAKLTPDVNDQWLEQAKEWVDAFNKKTEEMEMTTRDGLPDSYFNQVDHIYPVEVTQR